MNAIRRENKIIFSLAKLLVKCKGELIVSAGNLGKFFWCGLGVFNVSQISFYEFVACLFRQVDA